MFTFPNNFKGSFLSRPFNYYVFGSQNFVLSGAVVSSSIMKYDGSQNSLLTSSLTDSYSYTAASSISTTSYIFGGTCFYSSGNPAGYHDSVNINRFTGTAISTLSTTIDSGTNVGMSSTTTKGIIYLFSGAGSPSLIGALAGGSGSPYAAMSNKIQRYDGTTRTTDSSVLSTLSYANAAATLDNTSFIMGGYGASKSIQRYDGTTRTTDSSVFTNDRAECSAAVANDKITVFGDYNNSGANSVIESYNGKTTTIESAVLLQSGRFSASGSNEYKIYVFGGSSSNNIQKYENNVVTVESVTLAKSSVFGPSCTSIEA